MAKLTQKFFVHTKNLWTTPNILEKELTKVQYPLGRFLVSHEKKSHPYTTHAKKVSNLVKKNIRPS